MRLMVVLVALALAAQAQNIPHLGYCFPAGGQQGTTVEVTFGGQFLQNVTDVFTVRSGLKAKVIRADRPMNANQANELRDRMQELQKLPAGPAVLEEMIGIRGKLLIFNSTRQIGPVLAETLKVEIAVAGDAAPGKHELRVLGPQGLSNPVTFQVGKLPEVVEEEEIRVVRPAQGQGPGQVRIERPSTDRAIAIPAVVNGRIRPGLGTARAGQQFTPGSKDRYRFQARRGQDLAIVASARELMPYLADAVPGWFQAVLTLYDSSGREVAYDDDYRFDPDPRIYYRVPADGEYSLEIRDAIYRGREDFVYRIAIYEGREPAAGGSNRETAHLKLPAMVRGAIGRATELDVYRFEGRAGQKVAAEVYARREGSPLDSFLKLTDARGKQIAFNDDCEDKGAGLVTHQADSRILATLPASGTYLLTVGDVQQRGGPEYEYRLRVSQPEPDFELLATPSAINSWGGMTTPITVHALRKDGFTGEIRVNLRDAPLGFVLSGAVLPEGQDSVRVGLTTPAPTQREPLEIHLEGHAQIGGREVTHEARPADDMMQAFFYRHLVPAEALEVAIRRGLAFFRPMQMTNGPLTLGRGAEARVTVRFALPPNSAWEKLDYNLDDPPEGVTLKEVRTLPDGAEIVLACGGAKAGVRGNLIVNVTGERTPPAGRDGRAGAGARQRIPLGTLPAVPFVIQ